VVSGVTGGLRRRKPQFAAWADSNYFTPYDCLHGLYLMNAWMDGCMGGWLYFTNYILQGTKDRARFFRLTKVVDAVAFVVVLAQKHSFL
jgi:hypothetical protein